MNKKMLALVGGAGLAAGLLFAPDKGSRTIKKLSGRGKKIIDGVKKTATGEINSVKKSIRSKVDDVKNTIRSSARVAANATLDAEEKIHQKFRSTIQTAAKAAGSGPVKKTTNRHGAAKKASRVNVSSVKKVSATRPSRPNSATKKTARVRPNGHSTRANSIR